MHVQKDTFLCTEFILKHKDLLTAILIDNTLKFRIVYHPRKSLFLLPTV